MPSVPGIYLDQIYILFSSLNIKYVEEYLIPIFKQDCKSRAP